MTVYYGGSNSEVAQALIPKITYEQVLSYMGITAEEFDYILKKVLLDVKNRREDAAYNGEWGDRGAGELEKRLNDFVLILQGTLPDFISKTVDELRQANDPEYQQYLKLHAKFGDGVK